MKGIKLTQEKVLEVVRLFPDHTKQEIAELAGVGRSTVDRIQARYGLRKSIEHLHNMGSKAGKASSIARGGIGINCYTPEAIAKRVESYKKRYRLEDARVRWGLKQETKIHLRHGCKQADDQKHYLRTLGYIINGRDLVAYYTTETKRATRLEKLKQGETKGPFHCYYTFKPYENDKV